MNLKNLASAELLAVPLEVVQQGGLGAQAVEWKVVPAMPAEHWAEVLSVQSQLEKADSLEQQFAMMQDFEMVQKTQEAAEQTAAGTPDIVLFFREEPDFRFSVDDDSEDTESKMLLTCDLWSACVNGATIIPV